MLLKPRLDRTSLIGVAISSNHGVRHSCLRGATNLTIALVMVDVSMHAWYLEHHVCTVTA